MTATVDTIQVFQKLYFRFLSVSQGTEWIHGGIQLPFPHHTLHFLQTIISFPKKTETSSCVPYHPTDSFQIRPETWRTYSSHLPSTWQQDQRTYGLLSTREHYCNRTNECFEKNVEWDFWKHLEWKGPDTTIFSGINKPSFHYVILYLTVWC